MRVHQCMFDALVVSVRHTVYAIDGKCAHQGGPLWNGDVENVGHQQHRNSEVRVTCPWHKYTFGLSSGNSVSPAQK